MREQEEKKPKFFAPKNASEEADSAEEQEMFEKDGPKATLYFSHSEAVLPFLSLLGLNKDDYALTHSNYEGAKERYVHC